MPEDAPSGEKCPGGTEPRSVVEQIAEATERANRSVAQAESGAPCDQGDACQSSLAGPA